MKKKKADARQKVEKSKKGSDSLKENPSSDFKYTMTDDGAGVKITAYIGKSPKIIIPAEIEGLPVLEVEALAECDHEEDEYWNDIFDKWVQEKNNITITHIVFPDSVRKTGGDYEDRLILDNFDVLEYVKLPAGIKEWEDKDIPNLYHKAYKSSLTGRGIPINSLPSFNNCDKLKTVIIPEGIKAMPQFSNCKVLDSISLPSTVEYLSENAFNGCASLKEVNIPDSVEKIAFYYIGEYGNSEQEQFVGTNFNLATQASLKQLGYKGSFGAY